MIFLGDTISQMTVEKDFAGLVCSKVTAGLDVNEWEVVTTNGDGKYQLSSAATMHAFGKMVSVKVEGQVLVGEWGSSHL